MSNKVPDILPWRIVVAGDFSPQKTHAPLFQIDKYSFDDYMKTVVPTLQFFAPDVLVEHAKQLCVDLSFSSLRDFHPDAIAQAVPVISAVLSVKESVQKFANGQIAQKEMQHALLDSQIPGSVKTIITGLIAKGAAKPAGRQSAPKPASDAPQKKSSVDSILSMVETGDSSTGANGPNTATAALDLAGAIGAQYGSSLQQKDVKQCLDAIDSLVARQMNEILHAASFRELEASWRGLKFLVDTTDFKKDITIECVSCAKEDLYQTLVESVFQKAWQTLSLAPDVIVSLHPFNNSEYDRELVENLAKLGQSAQTLMLCQAGPRFFGVEQFTDLPKAAPSIAVLTEGVGYERWRALREKSEAEWLFMATNDFYSRLQYTAGGKSAKLFAFEESRDVLPCQPGVVATASLLARTFASVGEEAILTGNESLVVNDLPLSVPADVSGQAQTQTCPIILSPDQAYDLADHGFAPVNCRPNSPGIYLESVDTFGSGRTNLPSMVMAGHILRIFFALADANTSAPCEEIESLSRSAIRKLLYHSLPELYHEQFIKVTVHSGEAEHAHFAFEIDIQMPYPLLGKDVSIKASFTL